MKKRLRIADLKFIRDLVAEVYNSQSDMRRALTSNDLAAVLREINLSDKQLTTLLCTLNKFVEYFKDDEYLQGGY
jgi:hypothetical protein